MNQTPTQKRMAQIKERVRVSYSTPHFEIDPDFKFLLAALDLALDGLKSVSGSGCYYCSFTVDCSLAQIDRLAGGEK